MLLVFQNSESVTDDGGDDNIIYNVKYIALFRAKDTGIEVLGSVSIC